MSAACDSTAYPRESNSLHARSVARPLCCGESPPFATSTVTSSTIAGTSVAGGMLWSPDRGSIGRASVATISRANVARKKSSPSTAESICPKRPIASRRRPACIASPTPIAPVIVAATTPHATANTTTCGHHSQTSRNANVSTPRTGCGPRSASPCNISSEACV